MDEQVAVTAPLTPALPHNESENEQKIKQSSRLVYYIFLLQGIGILMPWNMFLNISFDYYQSYKFMVPHANGTRSNTIYSDGFQSAMTLSSQIPNLVLNLVNVFINVKGDLTRRITACLTIISIIILVTVVLIFLDTVSWMGLFFITTICCIVLLNGANGVYQNSMFGVVSEFPFNFTNAIIIGQNFCGILVTVFAIVTKTDLSITDIQSRAAAYFLISLFVILACIASLQWMKRLSFYQFYAEKKSSIELTMVKKLESHEQLPGINGELLHTEASVVTTEKLTRSHEVTDPDSMFEIYKSVFCQAKMQLFNIFFLFFVTLTIFPNIEMFVADNLRGEKYSFIVAEKYFIDVTTFLNFNVFAFVGSIVADYVKFPSRFIWIPVVVRAIYLIYFPFCNYLPIERTWPVLFPSTWLFVFNGFVLAFTSGYFSSLIMMYAPRCVPAARARYAGMMAGFFLIRGIVCGLLFSVVDFFSRPAKKANSNLFPVEYKRREWTISVNTRMWLECLLFALLAGTTTQTFCEPIEYFDPFPNCVECARVVGNTRLGINNIINGFDTAIHVFCELHPSSEEKCMATKDLIMQTMEQTRDAFFPRQYEKNVSRVVACAHGFKICPDLSKECKPLKEQEWSCPACASFFDALFELIRTPINEVNTLASGFFCQEKDESCINAFKVAIQLGGSLGDIFKDQKITGNVCRNIIKCIE